MAPISGPTAVFVNENVLDATFDIAFDAVNDVALEGVERREVAVEECCASDVDMIGGNNSGIRGSSARVGICLDEASRDDVNGDAAVDVRATNGAIGDPGRRRGEGDATREEEREDCR